MNFVNVSIPKKQGPAASPVAKSSNVRFVRVRDIEQDATGKYIGYPGRNGVVSTSNLLLKEGAKAYGFYMTPKTIGRNDNSDGDSTEDMGGFLSNFTGSSPGDEAYQAQFVQDGLNEDWVIISEECSDSRGIRLQGSPCNPMKMSVEGQDNNDGKRKTLTFVSSSRSSEVMMHYRHALPEIYDNASDEVTPGSGSAGAGV